MDRTEELTGPSTEAPAPTGAAPQAVVSPATTMFSAMGNAAAARMARGDAAGRAAPPERPHGPPAAPRGASRAADAPVRAALARAVLARDNGAVATPPAPATTAEETPKGTVEDAKQKAKEDIQAKKKAIVQELWKAIDALPEAPKVGKQPLEGYSDRLKEAAATWLNTVLKALEQKLQSLAGEIANSDIGKGAVKAAKDIADAVKEDEVLREIVEEISKILKEVYEKDSATVTKKIKVKGGELGAKLKLDDITSGVTKAAGSLELVTDNFSAEVSFKGDKVSIDMTAALAADAKLKAHIDETGGEISLTMITKSGKVVLVPGKVPGGKGEVSVPAEVRETMLSAKVDEAAGRTRATVAAQLAARRYARNDKTGRAEVVTEASVRAQVMKAAGNWSAGVEAKYRDQVIEAAISAAVQHADGATTAELAAAVTYALNKTWSVYFGVNVKVSPQGSELGGAAGVTHKPSGIRIGGTVTKTRDGDAVITPGLTIPF